MHRLFRAVLLMSACLLALPALASAKTVVSLTFDDGNADQATVAAPMLAAHGMHGTFYINSGLIGQTGKMTWDQVRALAASGNEIGGHTLSHDDLTQDSGAVTTQQVCNDRSAIAAQMGGVAPTDFAYPFGAYNTGVESIVKNCGYDTGRVIGNLQNPSSCQSCLAANDFPQPADPFAISTNSSIKNDTPLSQIEWDVTNAESQGGGWVPLVFHHVGTDSADNPYQISPATLQALLDWLQPRSAQGTVVMTMAETFHSPAPTRGPNLVSNSGMETVASSGVPTCYSVRKSTSAFTATYSSVSSPVHSGAKAEAYNSTSFTGSLGPMVYTAQDAGTCAPGVIAGHFYKASIWYQSPVPVYLNVYYRNSSGSWVFWKSSAQLPAASDWSMASYKTPAIPDGATNISIGLEAKGTGSIFVDDFYLDDVASES